MRQFGSPGGLVWTDQAKYRKDLSKHEVNSPSVRIGIDKMYKIGIGINMFFGNQKAVLACYFISKIVISIGKVKIFIIGKNRFKVNQFIHRLLGRHTCLYRVI